MRRIVYDARYVVLGLGDVYLGAPVATPVDPRHRLVTTKYNPARTWTPQNAVGIGGAYMCIYGMESPGGYQLVGRTIQIWNTYRTTKLFEPGSPWLLRFFDQIRYYPVSAAELLELRDAFPYGRFEPRVEKTPFRLSEYHRFQESIAGETAQFRGRREASFAEELARWASMPQSPGISAEDALEGPGAPEAADTGTSVNAPLTASVWKIAVETGQSVAAGQTLVVLEAMKTEIVVASPTAGVVRKIACKPGALVTAGQRLLSIGAEERA